MSEGPRLGGFLLPLPKTVVYVTIVASVASYFLFNRAAANLIAIAGGIFLTVVFVMRDRQQ